MSGIQMGQQGNMANMNMQNGVPGSNMQSGINVRESVNVGGMNIRESVNVNPGAMGGFKSNRMQ